MNVYALFKKDIPVQVYARKHFPRVYRIITERRIWLGVIIILSIFLLCYFGMLFPQVFSRWYASQQKRIQTRHASLLWKNIGVSYGSYPDAYFQAALFAYQLRDWKSALQDLQTVLYIDPTFHEAVTLQKLVVLEREREEGR